MNEFQKLFAQWLKNMELMKKAQDDFVELLVSKDLKSKILKNGMYQPSIVPTDNFNKGHK